MRKILKDGVIYLEEEEVSEEVRTFGEALAELQEREKARDPKWIPKFAVDLAK